jgi:hypothetical protein
MLMLLRTYYFNDSAVYLSASIMLLATGFFGLSSFTSATSPLVLDLIRASILSLYRRDIR